MRSRSIRRSGQPTCAIAPSNAGSWTWTDPRRALWPAVTCRTHGCTDQRRDRKFFLANFGAHPAHSIAPNSSQRLADCAEIARAPDGKYHVEPGWTTTENIRETTESLRYNDDRKRQDYDKFPPELAEQLATGPSRKLIADLEAPIDLSVKSNGDHENGESQTGPGSRVR